MRLAAGGDSDGLGGGKFMVAQAEFDYDYEWEVS